MARNGLRCRGARGAPLPPPRPPSPLCPRVPSSLVFPQPRSPGAPGDREGRTECKQGLCREARWRAGEGPPLSPAMQHMALADCSNDFRGWGRRGIGCQEADACLCEAGHLSVSSQLSLSLSLKGRHVGTALHLLAGASPRLAAPADRVIYSGHSDRARRG